MFNGYCPLIKDEIHEGICIEILAELGGGKKEEIIIEIVKKQKLNNTEMDKICEECPNYPF